MDFQHESLILSDVFLHLLRHYKEPPPSILALQT